jgi:hypothetical protein
MKRQHVVTLALLLGIVVAVLAVGPGSAQTGDGFDLTWHVLGGAGGDGPMSGDGFSLDATLSQTAIGPAISGDWLLGQGYWYGMGAVAPPVFGVYIPLLFK